MVANPISMDYEENSSDIELTLDVTEEADHTQDVPPPSNGLMSIKKNSEKGPTKVASDIDEKVVASVSDKLADDDVFDEVELDSTPCKPAREPYSQPMREENSSCDTGHQTDNHIGMNVTSDLSSSKTNGLVSRRNSKTEDTAQNGSCAESNSSSISNSKKPVLTNGVSLDVPSLQREKVNRVTNVSDSEVPKKSLTVPYKRKLPSDLDNSESESVDDTSNFLEKRSKVDRSYVPNRSNAGESCVSSAATTTAEQKKKTTARKSTTAAAFKMVARIVEEESQKQRATEVEDFVKPIHCGDEDVKVSNCIDVNASSQNELPERSEPSPNYPISFTPEMFSDECLANIFKKMEQRLSRRQLEEIVLHTCCEMISENSKIGELKKEVAEFRQTEVYRKQTVYNLEKQNFQLKGVCNVFLEKARVLKESSRITMPTVVTRSVGLQVAFDSSPYAKLDANSPSTRQMSTDEDDQKPSSSSTSSHRVSLDAGHSSGSSSPISLRKSSSNDITNTENSKKLSLPASNDTASSGYRNASATNKSSPSVEQRVNNVLPSSEDVIVDLTDLDDKNDSPPRPSPTNASRSSFPIPRSRLPHELPVALRHPAPLPSSAKNRSLPGWKLPPPKPDLTVQKNNSAIQMTWNLMLNSEFAEITKYQIFAYQETSVAASVDQWKLVGDVDSLALPMACTLTQFEDGYTYHFAVRAVDTYGRVGPFSCARSIAL